jgi:uncharacterized protein
VKYLKPVIISLFLLIVAVGAQAAKLPKPEGWVSDFAGVMDAASREKTAAVVQELERKTSAEIAVVTVKKLEGETVESYAADLLSAWGIGKKDKDNGVLILAAIEDRRVRIEVGYGLEGILPDGKTGEILDRYILPPFKEGNYGQGVFQGALAVASVIAKDAGVEITGELPVEPAQEGKTRSGGILSIIIMVLLFIFFVRHPFLFLLLMGGGGRHGGGFGGGFGGGGFGGFGGGSSGGGGASRGW